MQTRTKILIFLAVWKRPEITELCFRGIERLRMHPDFEIDTLAVISEPEMVDLCRKYKINFTIHANEPLGKKKNAGLHCAREHEFEYLMEIGSDDLILNELLDSYKEFISQGVDFFGIRDAGYICSETGSCRRLATNNATYGAGRMISRKLLERCNFTLWRDHLSKGLDNFSVFALMKHGVEYKKVKAMDFPGVIDVKGPDNIWPFNHLVGVPYDIEKIFAKLSDVEVEMIKSMYEPVNQN